MCEAYASLGYEVELIVPRRPNAIRASAFSYFGIPESFTLTYISVPNIINAGPFGRALYWLEGIFFLGQLWRQVVIEKDAIIISRSLDVALIYTLRSFHRVVFEVHDWPERCQWLFGSLLRRIPRVVVTAQGLFDECMAVGVRPLLAPNGVDESFFTPFVSLDKAKLGIPTDKKIVMYIGALAAWKGVDTLLEASRELPPSYQVVVVGGQPSEIAELSASFPKVLFLGQTPPQELVRYQALADMLVVPNSARELVSSKYTSPIKLFAHLTSRRPVIVADLPSIRAIVSEREVVFFAGSVASLVKAIDEVSTMNEAALGLLTEAAYLKSLGFTWIKRATVITEFVQN